MATEAKRLKQVVDWSAAFWAGLIAGTVFLLINVFVTPHLVGGNSWMIVRYFASPVLGENILMPTELLSEEKPLIGFDGKALVAMLVSHYLLTLGFTFILAFIVHRWGLLTGILLGALFGLALYCINFYTFTLFFPWFWAIKNWVFLVSHIVFGALAGGIYESFEVEEFVDEEGNEVQFNDSEEATS
ncbi:MAG: hypothetical protein AAF514_19875 [Verrucomicrobiota bacterium]